ncbi:DUF805 domain-containing protein [Bacillus sp. m3-13]|uniref:DUF805 domain-containing protein n=1 Tax=Bacillus sp. m3-13 TaxID=406124 RepID=UPI0001E89D04|nr:DUF805 domain-containing protein [Bacillus sp. m3-13]
MHWYLEGFRNYFNFSGRAGRKEYWIFTLVHSVIFWVIPMFIAYFFQDSEIIVGIFGLFYLIFILGTIIPVISINVRRLHDIGKSGWWYLIILIPIVGGIILFVFACIESEHDNKYGPNPRKYDSSPKGEALTH